MTPDDRDAEIERLTNERNDYIRKLRTANGAAAAVRESEGAARIAEERRRQVTAKEYVDNELTRAAVAFVGVALDFTPFREAYPSSWSGRPPLAAKTEDASLRALEKAGALIAAEIDRRLRARAGR
jgi:hypothetical protein